MTNGIVEIIGFFLIVVGCGAIVGAAWLISVALGVLSLGLLAILGGVIAIYVANARQVKATP